MSIDDPDSADGHKFDIALDDAMSAFWASIAESYPEIKTGDLDPITDHQFREAADHVVRAWVWSNTPAVKDASGA